MEKSPKRNRLWRLLILRRISPRHPFPIQPRCHLPGANVHRNNIVYFQFSAEPQHQIPTAAYAVCVKAANLCAFQFSLIEWTLSRHLQQWQSHWMRITCSIAVTTQLFRFVSRTEPKGELWVSFVSRGTWCVVMSSIRWNFRNYVCGVGATNWRKRCGRIKTKRKLHSQCTRKRIAFNHILPFKLWSRRVGLGLAHGTRYAHSNKHQII